MNCLYAYSLPSLISGKVLYGDLFTVVLAGHALIADRFSVIRRPKLSRLRNRWIGGFAYALGLLNAFFPSNFRTNPGFCNSISWYWLTNDCFS